MMKRTFLLLVLFSVFYISCYGQALKYKKIENEDLVYILNNIEKTIRFETDKGDLFVIVYFVSDPSGSAGIDGDDEITTSLYIAVSEDGEAPDQYLYRLSSVYDPRFIKWVKGADGPQLVITYGMDKKRKKATISITLKQLLIKTAPIITAPRPNIQKH